MIMFAALLAASQPGSLAETGMYDCLLGAVPAAAGPDDLPPRLDRRFALTIYGLRALEEDGLENPALKPGDDYVLTDPTHILGPESVRVGFTASNRLMISSAGKAGGGTTLALDERPLDTIWYLIRGTGSPALRGVCRLGREWPQQESPAS